MLCVVINGPSFEEAKKQIAGAFAQAGLFEFRLDQFQSRKLEQIVQLKDLAKRPVIFTLRPSWMGGSYSESEQIRLQELKNLCKLQPAYIDVESSVEKHFVESVKQAFPKLKIIVSHHDFEKTPEDLESLHIYLKSIPADLYKVAAKANCSSDALRLMLYLKNIKEKVIGISMGPYGLPSRLLNAQFDSEWTYAASHQPVHGQLTCQEMAAIYGCARTKETKLFGLIGFPLEKSISHYVHNSVMRRHQLQALYLKMEIAPQKLELFLKQLQVFGWQGLSVTMPHKEVILPFVEPDSHAQKIGAVNTLIFKDQRILGYNTDGLGAMRALERVCELSGKKIAIIGRGGAAKAIAYEASLKGNIVQLYGRNLESFDCKDNDVIINCTPVELPFNTSELRSHTIVMDINTLPKRSELLKQAEARGCRIVFGYEMFLYQALYQFLLWFPHLDASSLEYSLRSECEKVIDLLE